MFIRPVDRGDVPFDIEQWCESYLPHRVATDIKYRLMRWCLKNHYSLKDYFTLLPRQEVVSLFVQFCDLEDIELEASPMFYLARPYNNYRNKDGVLADIEHNVRIAEFYSRKLWARKIPVFCPHLNTSMFTDPEDQYFVQVYNDWIPRMSGVILMPNYEYSTGTLGEINTALRAKVPIYHWHDVIEDKWNTVPGHGAELYLGP